MFTSASELLQLAIEYQEDEDGVIHFILNNGQVWEVTPSEAGLFWEELDFGAQSH